MEEFESYIIDCWKSGKNNLCLSDEEMALVLAKVIVRMLSEK